MSALTRPPLGHLSVGIARLSSVRAWPRPAGAHHVAGRLGRVRVHPVLVGGGHPFFPPHRRRTDLELIGNRVFGSGVVLSRYRVKR